MTRDEAIKTMASSGWFGPDEVTEKWIDIYVALGMLKLDVARTIDQKIYDALRGKIDPIWVSNALESVGLQIVEKQ